MRNLYTLIVIALFCVCANAQTVPSTTILVTSPRCTGVPITFSAVANTSDLSYTWAVVPVKDLVSYSDLNTPTLSLVFSSSISHTVYLNASNASGTRVSFTTVIASKSPKASFNGAFSDVGYPTTLLLTNYSSSFTKSYWKFSDVADADSSSNTAKSYSSGGSYTVSLVAVGAKGCTDVSEYAFRISDSSSVILPNVFSPNGDGANDVYRPITRNISALKAWVFNRYGIPVASWEKVNGFWDGHTTAGLECAAGEYIIVLEAFGFDGQKYKQKGTITLVR